MNGRPGRVRKLTHGQARSMLAERLDWPLGARRESDLEAHLAACGPCRDADAAFRADRAALRLLREPLPPRDLPARTLAALDAEARRITPARGVPVLQKRGTRRSGGVAIGSLLTVGLVALVGTLLVSPGSLGIPGPAAGATPFAITPVDFAFVGIQNDVVRLYRTRLDQACPPTNASCMAFGPQAGQVVTLPRVAAVSGLTLDPGGRLAAIAARATATPGSTTYYVADLTGGNVAASPIATPVPTPSAAPPATPRGSPPRTHASTVPGTSSRTASPSPARSPAEAARTAAPSASSRTKPRATTPATAAASAAAAFAGDSPTAVSPGAPSAASGIESPAPTITVLPPVTAHMILQNVIPTGAGAAWSPDGSTLAFSAMPADGSVGSDIYVWHPGDWQATPLTSDHASSFASWANGRIVGSTTTVDLTDPTRLIPQSFVIDPQSGERRTLLGASIWLPSVDPTGRFAVGWIGTLTASGGQPEPSQGQLVFAPWTLLDPFTEPGVAPLVPSPAASESATTPGATPSETAAGLDGRMPAAGTPSAATPSPAPLEPAASIEPVATSAFSTSIAPGTPEPLDPSPNPAAAPVRDWLVRWTPDGSTFATWVSTADGGDVGTLSLHAVDTVTQQIDRSTVLLAPVAARRSFSLGVDRLCWATPPDFQGQSELRVALWGAFGRGELWSRSLDQQDLVPAS